MPVIGYAFALLAVLNNDPCPTRAFGPDVKPWRTNAPVYYDFEPGVTTDMVWAFERAVEDWNRANRSNRTNILFERAGLRPPNLYVANGNLPGSIGDPNGWALGLFEAQAFSLMPPHHLTVARLTIDVLGHDASRPSFRNALRKTAVHELGHSLGLDHPFPPEGEQKGATVMNTSSSSLNNEDNWNALTPTPCDIDRVGAYNGVIYSPDPGPTPKRPMPPHMPEYLCQACTVYVQGEPGAPRIPIDTYCCGGNGDNEGPRSPNPPPSMAAMSRAFIASGYHCTDDGWLQIRDGCHADLCCAHPDDLPSHIIGTPAGTACHEQGWWQHDQADRCAAQWNEACIKKEVCGAGPCMPWPHYCWKEPHDAPDPQPQPDPNVGVTCASKGWFNGNDYVACVAAHGACERKQDCDGQQCLPAPFYCWRPS
jgi:hypothetical protein